MVRAEPDMKALSQDSHLAWTMAANVGSQQTVTAGDKSFISGDVVCSGRVDFGTDSTVLGVVKTGTVTTPEIPITRFKPTLPAAATLPPVINGDQDVKVDTYVGGPLTITGNLSLLQSTLYVDGGLTVNGSLSGTGAVLVNGSVVVSQGADLNANGMVGLLATGDVTLSGSSDKQYFQGLVYSEGTFSASNLTIAGTFISHQPADSPTTSGLRLGPDLQVVYVTTATQIGGSSPTGSPTPPPNPVLAICPNYRCPLDANGVVGGNGAIGGWSDITAAQATTTPWTPSMVASDSPVDNQLQSAVTGAVQNNPLSAAMANSRQPNGLKMGGLMFQIPNGDDYGVTVLSIQYNPSSERFEALQPPCIACWEIPHNGSRVAITPDQFNAGTNGQAVHAINNSVTLNAPTEQDVVTLMTTAQQALLQQANGI